MQASRRPMRTIRTKFTPNQEESKIRPKYRTEEDDGTFDDMDLRMIKTSHDLPMEEEESLS